MTAKVGRKQRQLNTENVQDILGAMVVDTTYIDLAYNDTLGQLSASLIQPFGAGAAAGLAFGSTAGGTTDTRLHRHASLAGRLQISSTQSTTELRISSEAGAQTVGLLLQDNFTTKYAFYKDSSNFFQLQDLASSHTIDASNLYHPVRYIDASWIMGHIPADPADGAVQLGVHGKWDASKPGPSDGGQLRLAWAEADFYGGTLGTRTAGTAITSDEANNDGTFWLPLNFVGTIGGLDNSSVGSYHVINGRQDCNPANAANNKYYEAGPLTGYTTISADGILGNVMELGLYIDLGSIARPNGIALVTQENNPLADYVSGVLGAGSRYLASGPAGGARGYWIDTQGDENFGNAFIAGGGGGDGSKGSGYENYQALINRADSALLWQVDGDGILQKLGNPITGTLTGLPATGNNLTSRAYITVTANGTAVKIPVYS